MCKQSIAVVLENKNASIAWSTSFCGHSLHIGEGVWMQCQRMGIRRGLSVTLLIRLGNRRKIMEIHNIIAQCGIISCYHC